VIPRAKINGLLQALERDHLVRFNIGRTIEYIDCPSCEGSRKTAPVTKHSAVIVAEKPCERCGGKGRMLLVTGLAGGTSRYRLDMPGEVDRAYAMALNGPAPKPQPKSDKDFGDDPPW